MRSALLAAGVLAWAGAARAEPADAAAPLRPPNLRPAAGSTEAGLWGEADTAEAHVRVSAERNLDPALNAYVRGTLCRLAPEYCDEMRVYVLDRQPMNAAALPNGYVEVNSGLLLRASTEDELAFVLGHEITHFARNHGLIRWRNQKATANLVTAVEMGINLTAMAAMVSTVNSGVPDLTRQLSSITRAATSLNDMVYLKGMASTYAFSRENETEADRLGFERAAAAGYDRKAGVAIWRSLLAETSASDDPDVRTQETRASVFSTHPVTTARIAALAELAGDAPDRSQAELQAAMKRHRAAIRPYLGEWLREDLRRRDYGQTLYILSRLTGAGEDEGLLAYYRGEAYRMRGATGDSILALEAYRSAVSFPDAPVVAWRELGETLRRSGDIAGAVQALSAYLAKAPQADDRWLVETTLKSLQPGAAT